MTGGYSLTLLTSILAALTASPGAPAKFAKEGLLGEALLALAGMSAVEVGRTHLTGLLIQVHLLDVLPGYPTLFPFSVESHCWFCQTFELHSPVLPAACTSAQDRTKSPSAAM